MFGDVNQIIFTVISSAIITSNLVRTMQSCYRKLQERIVTLWNTFSLVLRATYVRIKLPV